MLRSRRNAPIRYDMFDLARSADEAKRYNKCQNIYHSGQRMAWNGTEVLQMLVEKHGPPKLDEQTRHALQRIFAIILWGELAAWRISAQLADELVPLEAKMAATSQVHDEARHFYVMHDYLSLLGEVPKQMDFAPRQLLRLVMNAKHPAHKILGMQLMVETLALTIFQTVRQAAPEPVLTELLTYYERDEARHVGLGMQYLPMLMQSMNKLEVAQLFAFQTRILAWGILETKVLEDDLSLLGADVREVMERGRAKQMAVMQQTFSSLGIEAERGPVVGLFSFAGEMLFPSDDTRDSYRARFGAAWRALRGDLPEVNPNELSQHEAHTIQTARVSAS